VARLSPDLRPLHQSTYLGGSGEDRAYALAIHPTTGEVYVAGLTLSNNFPNTSGGAQESYGGGSRDAFVAKLNSSLTQILQSTYLGGSGRDGATALAIHPTTGEVYAAGGTYSANFPNTAGGVQKDYGEGLSDAFVSRLNSDLTQIFQSTYLGGSGGDRALALAIHPKTGDVYVAGLTESNNFPRASSGAQGIRRGKEDGFVARLTADLAAVSGSGSGGSGSGGERRIRKR